MLIEDVKIESYKMQMNVNLENVCNESLSEEYLISDIAKFQIKVVKSLATYKNRSHQSSYQCSNVWIFGKLVNITKNALMYINISSKALCVKDVNLSADSKWHLIPGNYVRIDKFDIHFTLELDTNGINKLKILHDDEETNFEIRGDNCSIGVHKCMLAAISPVFKTMLQGDWNETKNGYVHLEGMSEVTLQDFKKYIYLNSLPSTVSEQVFLIAMHYDIPNMETICVKIFIQNMKTENVRDLIELAITLKSDKLLIEILRCVKNRIIDVDQINKHIFNVKNNGENIQEVLIIKT